MIRKFILSLMIPILAYAGPSIRCGFEPFPPYFYSQKAKNPGFAIELIRAVMPPDQCKIDFVHKSWGPTLANIHTPWSKIRAYAGVAHGDFPARFTRYPIFTTQSAVFVRKQSMMKYEDSSSLLKGVTGLVKDYSHTDELDLFTKKHERDGKIVFQTTDKNLRDLLSGKIMFLIDNVDSVYAALKRMNRKTDDVILLKKLDNATPMFLVFCWDKTYQPAVNAFNEKLKAYTATEAFHALRKKYGLEPMPKPEPRKKQKKTLGKPTNKAQK